MRINYVKGQPLLKRGGRSRYDVFSILSTMCPVYNLNINLIAHIIQYNEKGTKRKRFTDEENAAIRLGVERFAVEGEDIPWTTIKAWKRIKVALRDRDPEQIRLRWRDYLSR